MKRLTMQLGTFIDQFSFITYLKGENGEDKFCFLGWQTGTQGSMNSNTHQGCYFCSDSSFPLRSWECSTYFYFILFTMVLWSNLGIEEEAEGTECKRKEMFCNPECPGREGWWTLPQLRVSSPLWARPEQIGQIGRGSRICKKCQWLFFFFFF